MLLFIYQRCIKLIKRDSKDMKHMTLRIGAMMLKIQLCHRSSQFYELNYNAGKVPNSLPIFNMTCSSYSCSVVLMVFVLMQEV